MITMHQTILVAGIACLIAAIVGGGLKAFQIEIPVVNSPVRQTILGSVGLAMIGVGLFQPFTLREGAGSASEEASPPSVDGDPERAIAVQCTAEPSTVSAGGQVRIRVRVVSSQNTPISNARVRVRSEWGRFSGGEPTSVTGLTDENGVYIARWQAPETSQEVYEFEVTANKEGESESEGVCRVSGSSQEPQTGGAIDVECTVQPHAIAAGGQAAIRILALTERNEPVEGARVKISSGGGWFSGSGTTTEVGQTGENGVFATQWRAPDPAAQAYEMSVHVDREGFTGGEGTCTVPIK